ncbi:MAG: C-GCAxxG-C-C family protein, partial [Clostridiaceae bacterium]|nr:C-GCAxxG-C-C family protein [Clostridiaceae bacterium]
MKIKGKMNRLKFLKLSAAGAAAAGVSALLINSGRLFTAMNTRENNSKTIPPDTKNTFRKLGACSHTFFYILNREFGYSKENEERASDPLAGGLMNTQHQCGMLWGSTLAVGAESFRRHNDCGQAIAIAITATQRLVESFSKRAKTVNCR